MMCAAVVNGGCLVGDCSCPEEDCGSIKFTPLEGKNHKYRHTFLSLWEAVSAFLSVWEELVHSYQYMGGVGAFLSVWEELVHSYQYGRS